METTYNILNKVRKAATHVDKSCILTKFVPDYVIRHASPADFLVLKDGKLVTRINSDSWQPKELEEHKFFAALTNRL